MFRAAIAPFLPGRRAGRSQEMVHVAPVASVSVAVLAVSVCVTFVLTILFTYTTCVLQSQCPPLPQLPTVSDTWTHPPGNFVSREVVSVVALFLGLLQYVLWLPEQQAFPYARVCMRVGMFSAFCLSWVASRVLTCEAMECRSRAVRTYRTYLGRGACGRTTRTHREYRGIL